MILLKKILVYFLACVWLVVTGYPFVFIVQSSMKGMMEYFTSSVWALPSSFNLGNYLQVLEAGFHTYFFNSVIVATSAVVIIMLTASMASYAISRIDFRFNKWVYTLFLAGMMIPMHVTLIPVYNLTRLLGLYDSLGGLIGPYVAFSLP